MKAAPPSVGLGTLVPVFRLICENTLVSWMKQPWFHSVPTSELYEKVVNPMLPELLHSATLAMAVGPVAHCVVRW